MAPDVSWSPFVEIVIVLAAAIVFLAFRKPTRRSKRVSWAAALAGLGIAAVGTGVWGYQTVNAPLDDPTFNFCAPDPSPPFSSIVADTILQACTAGKEITLSRGVTVAIALQAEWEVDRGTQWTDLSVADPNVLREVNAPITVAHPNQGVPGPYTPLNYEVAVYSANQPGETKLSAVERACNGNLHVCDRGRHWWVTIKVD